MTRYVIEARSFRVALVCSHNFWVLKDACSGTSIAELHGLAYDRVTRRILPIGTTRNHRLRVFLFAHDAHYAGTVALPVSSSRMFRRSRAHIVHEGADGLARWSAAVNAMPLLDDLDLTYPPYGFNIRTPGVNSNSAYRTFGEIMGVRIHDFPGAFAPGLGNRLMRPAQLALARYRPQPQDSGQIAARVEGSATPPPMDADQTPI